MGQTVITDEFQNDMKESHQDLYNSISTFAWNDQGKPQTFQTIQLTSRPKLNLGYRECETGLLTTKLQFLLHRK